MARLEQSMSDIGEVASYRCNGIPQERERIKEKKTSVWNENKSNIFQSVNFKKKKKRKKK